MFPDIDEFQYMLEEISMQIPQDFYKNLNLGIVLKEEAKIHEEALKYNFNDLYIMGEYSVSQMGRAIFIYYGSFKYIMENSDIQSIRSKLKEVLLHEFRHHLENKAKNRDLEIEDEIDLLKYREEHGIE